MDWMGIGVLVIGIAFAVLVVILIKPLKNLGDVMENLKQTTEKLPNVVDDVTGQAQLVLNTSNETIGNVNQQVHEITPLFKIVGDTGEAARSLTQSALTKTNTLKENTANAANLTRRERYQGLYGFLSFLFYLQQNQKELKTETKLLKK
ncbi:DUF948 domain-containing protein [Sporosarcina gallistercoris]|uniref:DUF948 domain-containing protein n=1 Tax=Sporosarcina gallistercoris TaxID=2762245 RepID=A0ABR8PMS3_9BACL|nr:DUF948 domain-containing protein [Sporosarcina gallistercoris]MBD7909476.1 DUF948 domain-containing protein [Sporosarcina gallistercoris]